MHATEIVEVRVSALASLLRANVDKCGRFEFPRAHVDPDSADERVANGGPPWISDAATRARDRQLAMRAARAYRRPMRLSLCLAFAIILLPARAPDATWDAAADVTDGFRGDRSHRHSDSCGRTE